MDTQAAVVTAAAVQARAQVQSTCNDGSLYPDGAHRHTEGSTFGFNTYRSTIPDGSGPITTALRPNLSGVYGYDNSCTDKYDGYYHH